MALVLAPTDPLDAWFSDLDEVARRSPGFFGGRAIIVDFSAIKLSKPELKKLMACSSRAGDPRDGHRRRRPGDA